jgi:hypothetical protein
MTLSDIEYAVAIAHQTISPLRDELAYVQEKTGVKLSQKGFYRTLERIDRGAIEEIESIARNMPAIHAQRVRMFESLQQGNFKDLQEEESPHKRVLIRRQIAEMEKYIAQLQSISKRVLETYVIKQLESTKTHL